MGEFVQLPVPLTLAADVINVTFSRSLWPEKLNAEHLKKKKKKRIGKAFFSQWETPSHLANIPGPNTFLTLQ